jgi:hypothetical protein
LFLTASIKIQPKKKYHLSTVFFSAKKIFCAIRVNFPFLFSFHRSPSPHSHSSRLLVSEKNMACKKEEGKNRQTEKTG